MANPGQNTSAGTNKMAGSIAPWLSVPDSEKAVQFYKAAFNAGESYRLETPDGPIVKLSLNDAEFWVSGAGESLPGKTELGGGTIRMIVTVTDPDTLFASAIHAGATEIFPVQEQHGWRLGRLVDPFGLHWEIGHPIE